MGDIAKDGCWGMGQPEAKDLEQRHKNSGRIPDRRQVASASNLVIGTAEVRSYHGPVDTNAVRGMGQAEGKDMGWKGPGDINDDGNPCHDGRKWLLP